MNKPKIVMITMFKNEASVMRRMLESCYKYIDYFVIQNNGSTDGTDEIVKEFFAEKKIPGVLYTVEEGWVGFGWNRDHLIQVCQSVDHGCNWILKMDCDEVLRVDDDFDWTPLQNTDTQAFHIASYAGNCIYYRAWMWNAKLPWRFNHDPCHETVYCELPEIGENFERFNLDPKFCHIGYNEGQSWSNPTKFITDALVLEEKMIKNNTFSTDLYHFWYIGKSYFDCFNSPALPLGATQRQEYAKRAIYYFKEYAEHCKKHQVGGIELPYMSFLLMAELYQFIGEDANAIQAYFDADQYCPERNDHWYGLAFLYEKTKQYREMLQVCEHMITPERTCPFPHYIVFIDTSLYANHPDGKLSALHTAALNHVGNLEAEEAKQLPFMINLLPRKRLFVVDDFYKNPDVVRDYALTKVEYTGNSNWFKGLRSTTVYRPPGIKEAFESILGEKIENFEEHGYNGVFQICTSADPQVYHFDTQKWAAMIYLTPNAPIESGTRLHRSRINGTRDSREWGIDDAFEGDFLDSTRHDITDSAANIYNRLVIMDAKCIHSAGPYFGNSKETGRLTHLFFFD